MHPRTFLSFGFSTLGFLAAACGGSGFDNNFGGEGDGGAGDSAAGDSGLGDSSFMDGGGTADASTTDATRDANVDAGVCGPLLPGTTDVYVDSRFMGSPATGSKVCPLPTILDGITAAAALTGTRIVHVAGDTIPIVYDEADTVMVGANVILRGDGPAKTVLNAAGSCGSDKCAVMIEGGGTIEGFTVASPGGSGGDGIVANHTSPPPIVRTVTASGSKLSGVVALGAIDLGPNIVANQNGAQGIESVAAATGLVRIRAGANSFDLNGANGVNIDGAAVLRFEGGTASDNALSGIRLFGGAVSLGSPPAHAITSLTASRNGNTGISVFTQQSLTLRSSTLLANTNVGLAYFYALGTELDIGPNGGAGANVFGSATLAYRNGKAGIYLCRSRGVATQEAAGDSWSTCAPTSVAVSGCDTMPSQYVDVAYAPAPATPAGDPVIAAPCSVGP
jgi:hypothetical protein